MPHYQSLRSFALLGRGDYDKREPDFKKKTYTPVIFAFVYNALYKVFRFWYLFINEIFYIWYAKK